MTPSQLAKAAGISISTIGKYESQFRNPDSSIVKKLAIALETTTDYLLGMPQAAAIGIYDLDESQRKTLEALVRVIEQQLNANTSSDNMDEFE